MARKMKFTQDDDALLAELGVEIEEIKSSSRSPREERIIAGFEDIERFYEQHGHLPTNFEDKDIFERLYAVRLDKIRNDEECRSVLADFDKYGLLQGQPAGIQSAGDDLDDDALLAKLGVLDTGESDITKLTHVKTRVEIRAAEEIAKRAPCLDFEKFKSLFVQVREDLKTGMRQTCRFNYNPNIEKGDFFILGGQIVYVAEVRHLTKDDYGKWDARLRAVYDNGTESNLLLRSLQKALYKDEAGRRITNPSAGPLFSDVVEDGDIESGTIYILRSKSDHPLIKEHRDVIHKIGVTSTDISKRLSNSKLDPTFLMADVEVVATYELSNINPVRLENLIHKFFESARLKIEIKDRFGNPIEPREWFLVPFFAIDEAIKKIKNGTITSYSYDPLNVRICELKN